MLKCGDTFLTGDGDEDNFHLWIVITSPINGEVVTVSVTTMHRKSERLVILGPGDHPFITHESVVAYLFSKIRTVAEIEAAIRVGIAKMREPVDEALLEKIRAGLVDSDFTPNGVRHYYLTVCQGQ